jgi:hypothetical protein
MPFATTTIDRIKLALKLDASDLELDTAIRGKLSNIETISPGLVVPIEALITLIESKKAGYNPGNKYLIQADVLKWLGGKGLGEESGIEELKAELRSITGVGTIQGATSGGATFTRSDYLALPRTWKSSFRFR